MKYLFIILLSLVSFTLSAQVEKDKQAADQYRQDLEQARRAELLRTMDSAVVFMNEGQYELADTKFVYVLNNIKSVPSDLTFFFGKNSYHLNRYKQSVDWLNKYVQLRGTTGQFSNEALELLKRAESALILERSKEATKAQQVLSENYDIDCGPSGKVICPVCKGSTVVIRRGPFNNEYKTCSYCDKHGLLTCDEYNQLVRGELKPRQ